MRVSSATGTGGVQGEALTTATSPTRPSTGLFPHFSASGQIWRPRGGPWWSLLKIKERRSEQAPFLQVWPDLETQGWSLVVFVKAQGEALRTDTSSIRPSTGLFPISPRVATFGDPEVERLQATPPLSPKGLHGVVRMTSYPVGACVVDWSGNGRKEPKATSVFSSWRVSSQQSAKHGHSV